MMFDWHGIKTERRKDNGDLQQNELCSLSLLDSKRVTDLLSQMENFQVNRQQL